MAWGDRSVPRASDPLVSSSPPVPLSARVGALAALVLFASGCLATQPALGAPEAAPTFDPLAFFHGETRGLGTLRIRTRSPQLVRVESTGTPLPGDALRLVQTITRGDGEPTTRTWTLRRVDATTYTGTLTEATGPVTATVVGNELRIHYRTGRFTTVGQTLRLEPGGALALNLTTVRVLGVPVARLTEQIRRVDG